VNEDGLDPQLQWPGRCGFVNPPGGVTVARHDGGGSGGVSKAGLFLARARAEVAADKAKEIILLLPARVGYDWFQCVLTLPHAWLNERPRFVQCDGAAGAQLGVGGDGLGGGGGRTPHGYVVVYLGSAPQRFIDVFKEVGVVPGVNGWCH